MAGSFASAALTAWYSAPMESCIFCRIVAGTLPASVVFSDAAVMAFMDIQPVTEGHTPAHPAGAPAERRRLAGILGVRIQ